MYLIDDEVPPGNFEEQFHHQDSGFLGFTPDRHKVMLALLKSSNLHNHSVNHLTIHSKSNTSIICTIPINV